ncbi:MAG TPA: NAD(P)-dependent oxidoreductase [Bacteroidia bacterium]|nr:NAD(P)-dependent oxidoreductase [Bacteroidia bacterium]
MKPLLLILDDWEGQIAKSACWSQLRESVEIEFLSIPIEQAPDSLLSRVSFLMTLRERTALTKEVFAKLPQLKLLLQTGGHAYHIDQAAAKSHNIIIALGRRVKAPLVSVPELTIAMMLGAMHLLPQAQRAMHSGKWPLVMGRTLSGRRIGILGIGRHGSRVAHIAKTAFNMDVVAWARSSNYTQTPDNIPRLPLDELLRTSDVVSIHLRLSPESTGLLNAERLQMMKPGSVLVNTSRGGIINEPALISALTNGPLSAAGLDVFAQEPLSADSPLRVLNNVVLTPHIGWTVEEVFEEFAQIACTQLQQYIQGILPASELLA